MNRNYRKALKYRMPTDAEFDDPIAAVGRAAAFVGDAAKNAWNELSGLFGGEKMDVGVAEAIVKSDIQDIAWPTDSRRVTSEFDAKTHSGGIDIGASTPGVKGDEVRASTSGEITVSGVPAWSNSKSTYVVVNGDDQREYRYAHLDIGSGSTVGTRVNQGDVLGYMSDNGAPGQVHLHFEVWENGSRISPRSILP